MSILEELDLKRVSKPARYIGGEHNSIVKEDASVRVRMALAFPDVYEVGMSHIGLKILYHCLNKQDGIAAERVYAPWMDMEEQLRNKRIALYSLETKRPLSDFDIVGFTLQHEMSYTNILNMLDLGNIPIHSKDRTEDDPIVAVGGPCAYNVEPMADFVDVVCLGESEEAVVELAQVCRRWKENGRPGGRSGLLKELAEIEGNYVPSLYTAVYDEAGRFQEICPAAAEAKAVVKKRVLPDMNEAAYPTEFIVPYMGIVHDRAVLELFRGCSRGCRFCQAGMVYRPVRERRPEVLAKLAEAIIDSTGYDEISMMSLSSADYSHLPELVDMLMDSCKERHVSVSLPSLRVDSFSVDIAKKVQQVRKSGLTFAPEAGTQRLRDVINKGVTEEDLLSACENAFRNGWSTVKLYFMMGLPTETDEDLAGIADLAYKVANLYRRTTGKNNIKVTVSVSAFVPKPYTAFQWFPQCSVEEFQRKQQYLKSLIKDKHISYHYHDAKTSHLEAALARGDRRMGKVIEEAWKLGAKFDSWSECFDYDVWMNAFERAGIDPDQFAKQGGTKDMPLPWEHLSPGVSKNFLWREWEKSQKEQITADCRHNACTGCGVCPNLHVAVKDCKEEAKDGKITFSC